MEKIYVRCENCKRRFAIPKNKPFCSVCRSGNETKAMEITPRVQELNQATGFGQFAKNPPVWLGDSEAVTKPS